jgi:hypothetical protein
MGVLANTAFACSRKAVAGWNETSCTNPPLNPEPHHETPGSSGSFFSQSDS